MPFEFWPSYGISSLTILNVPAEDMGIAKIETSSGGGRAQGSEVSRQRLPELIHLQRDPAQWGGCLSRPS